MDKNKKSPTLERLIKTLKSIGENYLVDGMFPLNVHELVKDLEQVEREIKEMEVTHG